MKRYAMLFVLAAITVALFSDASAQNFWSKRDRAQSRHFGVSLPDSSDATKVAAYRKSVAEKIADMELAYGSTKVVMTDRKTIAGINDRLGKLEKKADTLNTRVGKLETWQQTITVGMINLVPKAAKETLASEVIIGTDTLTVAEMLEDRDQLDDYVTFQGLSNLYTAERAGAEFTAIGRMFEEINKKLDNLPAPAPQRRNRD